ncbi:MAG: hypothetical protein AAGC43_17070 [Bacteroidota bacterium]
MKSSIRILIIAITFVWVGMVLGISFLEAPLKFQAPNITTELGLGIGKLVFSALNKIEISFSILLLVFLWRGKFAIKSMYLYAGIFGIILVQSIWLIPVLNQRADVIISGQEVSPSFHHIAYVIIEVIKVVLLITAGVKFLKSTESK